MTGWRIVADHAHRPDDAAYMPLDGPRGVAILRALEEMVETERRRRAALTPEERAAEDEAEAARRAAQMEAEELGLWEDTA